MYSGKATIKELSHLKSQKERNDKESNGKLQTDITLKREIVQTRKKQEGHDGPGSLTRVSLEPNYFKICPPV